ncbi:MAG: hypothetical protein M1820_002525 [Bogoriella megaspora]|nr:MAG: hypothetical protein M1820_002525 [Bogoriella megaspora]
MSTSRPKSTSPTRAPPSPAPIPHRNHGQETTTKSKRLDLLDFDLTAQTFIVTGAGRGLGLHLASALAESGGKVYCLDTLPSPDTEFIHAQRDVAPAMQGSIHYVHADVTQTELLDEVITRIADENQGLDGLIAAAGVQKIQESIHYEVKDAMDMLRVNYCGVFMTATSCARQMLRYKCRGRMCLIASMSGMIANKGLLSPVYNSSKAAVIQLARNLAMEWGDASQEEGVPGIRVNSLSPGHIITPMVEKNFEEVPGLKETWEKENMVGRLARPEEFKAAALFLLSNASSFMTGSNLVIDGGHTAW